LNIQRAGQKGKTGILVKKHSLLRDVLVLMLLTAIGMSIAGYHPGCEDDGVYLTAIKHDLAPALYPHDADFFALQLQAMVFDKWVAGLIHLSHVPAGVVILTLHALTIFFVLWGCLGIVRRCFSETGAQWSGVTLVAVLLTLPVAGTALYLVDQNLHPRAMATAAILAAILAVLDRKWLRAGALLILAVTLHPMMGCYGISICFFLTWKPAPAPSASFAFALMPLSWVFAPTSKAWHVAAGTRAYYFLSRWEWYEWLGVIAPLALLWWFRRLGLRDRNPALATLATRLAIYGVFQLGVAIALLVPPEFARLKSFQPMRFLHLLYLLFVLLAGGLIGQKLQRMRRLRWAALLLPLAAAMFFAQRQTYASSAHLELPGIVPSNPWLQAFDWIRENTPVTSFFAVGAGYMERPGEDFHSFRALAERSSLADVTKDASVVTQVPSLAPLWLEQVQAQSGWEHFGRKDFERLHKQFGVDWLVLEQPGVLGLDCPYQNERLRVCRVGGFK
jgi:multisubunit Na+/H+ antiporter MnhG subunit